MSSCWKYSGATLFFWEKAHPITGLVNDRANNFGTDRYTISSCAATGFGLAALPIGIEHGWLERKDALYRAETTLRFLLSMPQVHGWMPHFITNDHGARVNESEYSSIDTALLGRAPSCAHNILRPTRPRLRSPCSKRTLPTARLAMDPY